MPCSRRRLHRAHQALARQVLRVVPQLAHAHRGSGARLGWTCRKRRRGDAAVWEKVIKKVRAGAMPPQGMPQPDAAARAALVSLLETTLDRAAAARPNPGRPALHRLNRAEYQNAIRDLLALDVDAASLLPADDSSFGFDNVADVLGVSPVLLERYLAAAEKISAMAVGDPASPATDKTHRVRFDLTQTGHVEGLPLGTRGGTLIRDTFPLDGEYVIKPKLWRTNVGFIRGLASPHQVEISVDGERVHLVTVGTPEDYQTSLMGPDNAVEDHRGADAGARADQGGAARDRRHLRAEDERAAADAAAAVSLDAGPGGRRRRAALRGGDHQRSVRGRPGPGDTPSRRRIFTCRPAGRRAQRAPAETACARQIITTLARRAYRRPVADADVAPLLAFYQTGRAKSGFDGGIQLALQRILSDPEFLFRAERDPQPAAARARVPHQRPRAGVAPVVLPVEQHPGRRAACRRRRRAASRIPRCSSGRCGGCWPTRGRGARQQLRRAVAVAAEPAERRAQQGPVPRLRRQPAAGAAARDRAALEHVMREDRSVLELLTADYTFVNERLARHYGIPNVYGTQFRRVPVTNDARRGLLGHGSILTVTSQPNRTSPVLRGKWILENLLGTPPPPPPANVPPLKENSERERPLTMREQMEEHRANPACASCHKLMDPLGFALENFDGVGAWRTSDSRVPIDPSVELADGTRVDGPVALRQALLARPEVFVGTMTEKMLTYALGRGLEHYDMPAVRAIVRDAGRSDYRFSSLVLGIVNSAPFQMRAAGLAGARRHAREPLIAVETLQESCDVHHQTVVAAPDVPAGHGRDPGAAAARRHGAGDDGPVAHGGRARAPVRRRLRAARQDPEPVDAGGAGRGLRVHADPQAARAASAITCASSAA